MLKALWGGAPFTSNTRCLPPRGHRTRVPINPRAGGLFTGFFDKLDNPYYFAAFVLLLIGGAGAAWMVVSGRINVQKLVAHLSADDTGEADA